MASAEELTRSSPLIFTGQVRRLTASTIDGLAPDEYTAVVGVDELIRGPEAFAGLPEAEITVYLLEPGSPGEGEAALFFATSWLAANSIAVRELGHQPVSGEVVDEIRRITAGLPDDEIAGRARRADVIVEGRVAEVRPSPGLERDPSRSPSEHDPLWHEAELEVEAVAKGELPVDRPVVLFPASQDVAWYASPKFEPGQRVVVLLHRADVPEPARARADVFTALDSKDVQPPGDLERVQKLADRE